MEKTNEQYTRQKCNKTIIFGTLEGFAWTITADEPIITSLDQFKRGHSL